MFNEEEYLKRVLGKFPKQPKYFGLHPNSKLMNCECIWLSDCKRKVVIKEYEVKKEMLRTNTTYTVSKKYKPIKLFHPPKAKSPGNPQG